MRIIDSRPPNFAQIVKAFKGAERPGVIFAYAPDIYAPGAKDLPQSLIAHELVHICRQEAMGVELWWDKYIEDEDFRFMEELIAHQAEYNDLITTSPSRVVRRMALKLVAKKLASGLYGKIITTQKAMELMKNEQTYDR